jgi:hypothetical protein
VRGSRPSRGLFASCLVASLLAGCSIATEDEAHRLPDADVPFDLLEPGGTTVPEPAPLVDTAALYLVQDGRLEPVFREVPANASPEQVLLALADGPDTAEQAAGLTTALSDATDLGEVDTARGVATVDLQPSPGDLSSGQQALALAQIVFTLTAQPGIGRVAFTLRGEPVDVPDGSGALTSDPVAREDYADLAPPAS